MDVPKQSHPPHVRRTDHLGAGSSYINQANLGAATGLFGAAKARAEQIITNMPFPGAFPNGSLPSNLETRLQGFWDGLTPTQRGRVEKTKWFDRIKNIISI